MMAGRVLKKYKPEVIAITGSVGKTTTKEMAGRMLSDYKNVRFSKKNYNNEVGVPLGIIGVNIEPERSKLIQYGKVFLVWAALALFKSKNYPEVIVLEFGADHPGDIKYLCDFVPVSVGILTDIGISHLENFDSKDAIAREKGTLLRSLSSGALAVYNIDNERVKEVGEKVSANSLSYGFSRDAKLKASDFYYDYRESEAGNAKILDGVGFKLAYQGKLMPMKLNHCIGKGSVYAALAALGAGIYFDLNMVEMARSLKKARPAPGRMNLLRGIKKTNIIDDTYNSAPSSLKVALETMQDLKAKRKILALGDMLELGEEEENAHKQALRDALEINPEAVLLAGKRFKKAADSLKKEQKERVECFNNSIEAGNYLQKFMEPGDLILVKGSRGMEMEKAVKEVMRHPERAEELLV